MSHCKGLVISEMHTKGKKFNFQTFSIQFVHTKETIAIIQKANEEKVMRDSQTIHCACKELEKVMAQNEMYSFSPHIDGH